MASPRLLKPVSIVLALVLTSACTLGPVYTHHVSGRIVDHYTKQPIAGAEVFMSYEVYQMFWGGYSNDDLRCTTTDGDGRFEFPAHWAITRFTVLSATQPDPDLRWLHPKYGVGAISHASSMKRTPGFDWEELELTMVRDEVTIKLVNEGRLIFCSDGAMDCLRACIVWFGSLEECRSRSDF